MCTCVHACAIQEDVWERLCGPEKRQFEMMRPLEVSTGNGVEEQGAPTALWWEPTPQVLQAGAATPAQAEAWPSARPGVCPGAGGETRGERSDSRVTAPSRDCDSVHRLRGREGQPGTSVLMRVGASRGRALAHRLRQVPACARQGGRGRPPEGRTHRETRVAAAPGRPVVSGQRGSPGSGQAEGPGLRCSPPRPSLWFAWDGFVAWRKAGRGHSGCAGKPALPGKQSPGWWRDADTPLWPTPASQDTTIDSDDSQTFTGWLAEGADPGPHRRFRVQGHGRTGSVRTMVCGRDSVGHVCV